MSQFVSGVRVPEKAPLFLMEQPGPVCRVMSLEACELTPSMISISPFVGQLGPTVQLQTCQMELL